MDIKQWVIVAHRTRLDRKLIEAEAIDRKEFPMVTDIERTNEGKQTHKLTASH